MLAPRALAWSSLLAALVALGPTASAAAPCSSYSARYKKEIAGACVCNATQCDEISSDYQSLSGAQVGVFQTSLAGDRLAYSTLESSATSSSNNAATIVLDSSVTFQQITGFGGAFTDAAAINVYKLQPDVQQRLLDAYFSDSGLQYTLGRVPIGSTDFSESVYSYNPVEGDLDMVNFAIDIDKSNATHKLDLIKRALETSTQPITLFASSWAPPAWMTRENKTQNSHVIGEPGGPYWKAMALYYSKFFDAYKKEGVEFWAMTTQNEPVQQPLAAYEWQQLRFNATTERDFIKKDLGPLMKQTHPQLKIILMDDQKDLLPEWHASLVDPAARKYVSGIAVHWYKNLDFLLDNMGNFKELADFHAQFPDIFILPSEACTGSMPDGVGTGQGPKLLDPKATWQRGEMYARDIINDLANFAVGWTDWNLVLDTKGGPNWAGNVVDAPILVDEKSGIEFYKQPMFYVMGHFSKFLPPGSTRVALNVSSSINSEYAQLDRVAFLTPQKKLVLLLSNRGNKALELTVRDAQNNRDVKVALPANAVQTVLFAPPGGSDSNQEPTTAAPSSSAAASSTGLFAVVAILGLLM